LLSQAVALVAPPTLLAVVLVVTELRLVHLVAVLQQNHL
jgi:hypothetical protein